MAITLTISDLETEDGFCETPVEMRYVTAVTATGGTFDCGYFEAEGRWNVVFHDGYSWEDFESEAEAVMWIVGHARNNCN